MGWFCRKFCKKEWSPEEDSTLLEHEDQERRINVLIELDLKNKRVRGNFIGDRMRAGIVKVTNDGN
jgi:hypothetical protein